MPVTFCDACGAPIEARWSEIVLVCRYCGAQNAPGPAAAPVPPSTPDDGRPRLSLGGRTYVVEGLLGRGDSCDVYRGRWVMRLGELVVIKVLRSLADADLLRRERDVLERLHASEVRGAAHFAARLPRPVAFGPVRDGRDERPVAVHGWMSGYLHDLEAVGAEHPDGVDGQVVVWLLKRLLEVLGWVHQAGIVHGAVLPPHVLVHPRDHGATLVGWSVATAWSPARPERLPAVQRRLRHFYPDQALRSRVASPASDVAMAARCALRAAGSDRFDRAPSLPDGLGRLLVEAAAGRHDDAWALLGRVEAESLSGYGPPSYHPLPMPGWPRAAS